MYNLSQVVLTDDGTTANTVAEMITQAIKPFVDVLAANFIPLIGFLAAFMAVGFIIRKVFGKLRS